MATEIPLAGRTIVAVCAEREALRVDLVRAERREQNLQALISYMRDEVSRITGVPHEQPSDIVETVRQLYDMAETWKSERAALAAQEADRG